MEENIMVIENYLKNKIKEVGCLYKHDLLKDFLQGEYRKYDYLYNFYSSCVKEIESTKLPNYIYKFLWEGKQEQGKVPDVMNSFNTYMNKMVDSMINNKYYDDGSMNEEFKKFKEILDAPQARTSQQLVLYFIRNHEIKEKMNERLDKMIQLSKWTNTIGNFVLLPNTKVLFPSAKRGKRSENVYKNHIGNDRMDVYLDYLKDKDVKAFKNYINKNYLWDYVDEEYNVIPLFPKSYNTKFDKELPNDPRCYIVFAKNTIDRIKRRGMFMEIMIRLRIELKEKFEDVNKIENLSSYSNVIETIKKLNISEELRYFIEEFQMGIV